MPPTPPELCCRGGHGVFIVRLNTVRCSMFAPTPAATQFGEREGNRFPSLLRLVSLLNHNLPVKKNYRGLDRWAKMWYSNNIDKNCDGKSNRKEPEREWKPWL